MYKLIFLEILCILFLISCGDGQINQSSRREKNKYSGLENLSLPSSIQAKKEKILDEERFIVNILKNGKVIIEGKRIKDQKELKKVFFKVANTSREKKGDENSFSNKVVLIRVDKETFYINVKKVIVLLAEVGIWKLEFSVIGGRIKLNLPKTRGEPIRLIDLDPIRINLYMEGGKVHVRIRRRYFGNDFNSLARYVEKYKRKDVPTVIFTEDNVPYKYFIKTLDACRLAKEDFIEIVEQKLIPPEDEDR